MLIYYYRILIFKLIDILRPTPKLYHINDFLNENTKNWDKLKKQLIDLAKKYKWVIPEEEIQWVIWQLSKIERK